MKKSVFSVLLFFAAIQIHAQILCPEDVTQSCFSDIWPAQTGTAQLLSSNFSSSMLKYSDENDLNGCSTGTIARQWSLDVNFNDIREDNEPFCTQLITLTYENLPLNVQFPQDREYSCTEDIANEVPTWSSHPCDMVGYTYNDETFNFAGGACLKIVRTFKVINWCIHDATTGEGEFLGIQIIKIIDEEVPELQTCADITIDATENCEATVTLSNSAIEEGDCPSEELTYYVSVDLWADGTEDLVYGPNEPLPFKINPVGNGEEISITFPDKVGIGKHKVYWTVQDGCNNVRTCQYIVTVADNKPPTPYCFEFLSASFDGSDGGQLVVPVDIFSLETIDNCSDSEDVELSFSENIDDKERILECGDAGIRFFRIYSTDEAGNQDFCEVYMLVLDNGTCFGKFEPIGSIKTGDGNGIEGAQVRLMDGDNTITEKTIDASGVFSFGEQSLMDTYSADVQYESDDYSRVDLEDFLILQRALLGWKPLTFYQSVAADLDGSGKVGVHDLVIFRDYLTGKTATPSEDNWLFIPSDYDGKEVNALSNFPRKQQLTEYGNGFHFTGVQRGDLSSATMAAENEENSVPIEVAVYHDKVIVSNISSLVLDGFEFILSENNSQNDVNFDYKNSIPAGAIRLEFPINSFDLDNLSSMLKIYPHKALKAATLNLTILDYTMKSDDTESSTAYPNPFQNTIMISEENISDVQLLSTDGTSVSFNLAQESDGYALRGLSQINSGLYILSYTVNGKKVVQKVVK